MHGGKTPKGADSPHFVHGGDSKFLPVRMQEAYLASLNDPQIGDLNKNIALIEARRIDLLTRVDTGESGALWKDVKKAWRELRKAQRSNDDDKVSEAMAAMDDLLIRAGDDYQAWSEIIRLTDEHRKHVETRERAEIAGERAVSVTELMTFMGGVMNLINRIVPDQSIRQQLAHGIERLSTSRTDAGGRAAND